MCQGTIEKTMSLRSRLESRQMNLEKAPWMALMAAPSYGRFHSSRGSHLTHVEGFIADSLLIYLGPNMKFERRMTMEREHVYIG